MAIEIDKSRQFAVAPMLDWTDRHCRMFHRILSPNALLVSEMVTTGALLYGDVDRHLKFNQAEHPVVLQLGGSEPEAMAKNAVMAEQFGYDEVNINVGCPSDRVQSGSFGACLMAEPETVARCVESMRAAVSIPVSVKSRIGIDDMDDYQHLHDFVEKVASAGCRHFTVHARKAWLKGLSPKENRDIPPLVYESVYKIKQAFPDLHITINGGITTIEQIREHLHYVDGVMMGREAYQNPYILTNIERALFNPSYGLSRHEAIHQLMPYIEQQLSEGVFLKHITRHILGLFQGVAGAKKWRRYLSENAYKPESGIEVVETALAFVTE